MKIILILFFFLASFETQGKSLITDLSTNSIKIDLTFKGKSIFLFGSKQDIGDVIVVVRGPKKNFIIRKKEKLGFMWLYTSNKIINNVDSYYHLGVSHTIKSSIKDRLLSTLLIDAESIGIEEERHENIFTDSLGFKDAIYQNGLKNNMYTNYIDNIKFTDNQLFKYKIDFPVNMPEGLYTIETYLIDYKGILDVDSKALWAVKSGLNHYIYELAFKHEVIYGLLAILLSLTAGTVGGILLRKI